MTVCELGDFFYCFQSFLKSGIGLENGFKGTTHSSYINVTQPIYLEYMNSPEGVCSESLNTREDGSCGMQDTLGLRDEHPGITVRLLKKPGLCFNSKQQQEPMITFVKRYSQSRRETAENERHTMRMAIQQRWPRSKAIQSE
jgi:hypothetical protein